MATDTPPSVRQLVLYEVYVRNHSLAGTFSAVEADLPRIRAMGIDVVWLMPIHPIGRVRRKGTRGSPYAIVDYTQVNPEYGSRADFVRLVERAHALGLKVMIDVVYNHTAPDSPWVRDHPDWYHRDASGQPITTVPAWSDIIDLRPGDPALTRTLIDALKGWVKLGVDGFRCDVASIIPVDFWRQARREIAALKPGVIWLAESVHASFVEHRRRHGLTAYGDGEIHAAFDLSYDYDIWSLWEAAVDGALPLDHYLGALRLQDAIYPAHTVKMRCVENHDQPRIAARVPDRARRLAWTAFAAFNKGAFLIYAGQESEATRTPSLFELEPIAWRDYGLQPFLTRLAGLKKDPAQTQGQFTLLGAQPALTACWQSAAGGLFGVFNVAGAAGSIAIPLPDGDYLDALTDDHVPIRQGQMALPAGAHILRYEAPITATPGRSPLLDYAWQGGDA